MANWYMKGQSNYESSSGFHMGLFFDMNGFPEGNYDSLKMPDDVSEGDPFMAVAAETQPVWTPATPVIEFGLWDDYRLKVDSSGIWGWHEGSGVWLSLFGRAGNDFTAIHDNIAGEINLIAEKTTLTGIDLVLIEDSDDSYNKKKVQLVNLLSEAVGDPTPDHNDLNGLNDGDAYEHITQTQKTALHAIQTLQTAFLQGKIISGANSNANAVQIGDGANQIKIYELDGHLYIVSSAGLRLCATGDIDDYIQISSTGTVVTLDFVGGVGNITDVNNIDCSYVRHDGNTTNRIGFGTNTINLEPGSAADYIRLLIVSETPVIKSIGGAVGLAIQSDNALYNTIDLGNSDLTKISRFLNIQGSAETYFDTPSNMHFRVSGLPTYHLMFYTVGTIPHIGVQGDTRVYFRESSGGAWEDLWADLKDQASVMSENTLEKIKLIQKQPDGHVEYSTLPSEISISEAPVYEQEEFIQESIDTKGNTIYNTSKRPRVDKDDIPIPKLDEHGEPITDKFTDVGEMMYFNLSAIKELIAEIDTLKARIEELENK